MTDPTAADPSELLLEIVVGAPSKAVWRALRDRDEIPRWFGWDHDERDAEIECVFHGAEYPGIPGSGGKVTADDAAHVLRVDRHEVTVTGEGADRTIVRMTRVAPGDGPEVDEDDDETPEIEEGWRTFLQTLAFTAARHRGEDRCTIFATGTLDDDAGDPLVALGLGPALDLAPGERYRLTAATGDELLGTVWFRSPLQVGLTVEGWGDGLLVAATSPRAPHRRAMAIASTYGGDDQALAARWARWWGQNATDVGLEPPAADGDDDGSEGDDDPDGDDPDAQ